MVCGENKGIPTNTYTSPRYKPSFISVLFLFNQKNGMAKKEWKLVPESDLTEEEVRRWFNRLRELYQESLHLLHERRVERGKLRQMVCELEHENAHLKRKIEHLNYSLERANKKVEKKVEKEEKTDFKKKFFDSL